MKFLLILMIKIQRSLRGNRGEFYMKIIMKGAVALFAALLAVVPGATAAENSPLGVSSNTTIEGASGLSNGILIAMLAQPNLNAADSQAAPNGGPLVRVSHKPSGSTNSALSLPAPRGKVIFEHHWSEAISRPNSKNPAADVQEPVLLTRSSVLGPVPMVATRS
jgi:hypothetical protein